MGYIKHDAIVVIGGSLNHLLKAWRKAQELGLITTDIQRTAVNAYYSFMICPDGSKEGWKESDLHNEARLKWKEWLQTVSSYADKPIEEWNDVLCLDWVHVAFGGDHDERTCVKDHSGLHRAPEDDE
jgi:hypothetical protein